MQETSNHIISKFRWDTSFDQKAKASELQERLSGWSRTNMQKEIIDIFDNVCPPEQTWRIDLLELDLGLINFNDLEFELAIKLRQMLNEMLIDLIIHANNTGRSNIEILNEDTSHISVLRSFLLEGVMPWNYKPVGGSVNQLMVYQLKNNRQQLIAMLREVGVTQENVRKRIAWQINDAGIIKIIEGLEPNNHSQIIDFSAEMVKIQMKETVVQAATADFKKNLWFWILNYLLTERGTIFSKVAFMKSSIRQMAAYYNVSYDELLDLIARAVDSVSKTSGVKSEFILTLKILSEENKSSKNKTSKPLEDTAAFHDRLKHLFNNGLLRKSAALKTEFNELVVGLFKQDQQAFRELILSVENSQELWAHAINDLNDASLEAIIAALSPVNTIMIRENIYFLHKLGKKLNPAINRKTLWIIAIAFLHQQKNDSFNNSSFLNYCITALSKKNKMFQSHLLDQLMNTSVSASLKTIATMDIYKELSSVFIATLTKKDTTFFKNNFEELIKMLDEQISSGSMDKELVRTLKKSLLRNIQLQPRPALQLLMDYADKKSLRKIFPYVLNDYSARLLMKHVKGQTELVLMAIQQVLIELKALEKTTALAAKITEIVFIKVLELIVLYPSATPSRFLELLLDAISEDGAISKTASFSVFTELLFSNEKLSAIGISKTTVAELVKRYVMNSEHTITERTNLLIAASQNKQTEIEKKLKSGFSAKEFEQLKTLKNKEREALLNCLVRGGQQLMEALVKEYKALLLAETGHLPEKEIAQLLTTLYWKCILNYKDHNGKKEMLKRSFKTAVWYSFSVKEKNAYTENSLKDSAGAEVGKVLQQAMQQHATEKDINAQVSISVMKDKHSGLLPGQKIIMNESVNRLLTLEINESGKVPVDELQKVERKGLLIQLTLYMISHKEIPVWFQNTNELKTEMLLNEIIMHYPVTFFDVVKQEIITEQQFGWLHGSVDFKTLLHAIGTLNKNKQAQLSVFERLYYSMGIIAVKGISANEIQYLFFRKLIKAWTSGNWRIISAENIWNELTWDVCVKREVVKKEWMLGIEKIKNHFPLSLQVSLGQLKDREHTAAGDKIMVPKILPIQLKTNFSETIKGGIPVKNAGLVLISNYVEILFDRLGMTAARKFTDETMRTDAPHYLQYVVTGLSNTEESLLPLNKVLCGLPLSEPLRAGINITDEKKKLINGLLNAMIGYWPAIGNCSTDGFRGNWLVREGLLMEHKDKWELTVEKRAYDILIHKSPFSFSIIKFPWMSKPLHVTWPY